jgi:putative transposase
MPRRPREYLPGFAYHIYQRGNNRDPCFIEPENYDYYLNLWRTVSPQYGISVHSYCLMTNHIHFLVTPECKTGLSNTMRVVGSRYAQYINRRYERTGTLWEGRHRSSLVQTDRYFLTCMRYIEMNPVRAHMAKRPEEYLWSSYGANAWGDKSWLKPHAEYLGLGVSDVDRYRVYRDLFQEKIRSDDLNKIRKAAYFCQPVGTVRFRKMLVEKYSLRQGHLQRGRPKKQVAGGVE